MDLYDFAKKNKNVKIVTRPIPDTIAKGFKIHDISVKAPYGRSDDEVYNNNADIRRMIARGNTILEYVDNGETKFIQIVRGFKKFTGYDKYDEDDAENADTDYSRYLSEQPVDETELYCMDKVNGKAGHISCFTVMKIDYVVCGSKNVHMILRRDHILGDINLYPNHVSHSIAKDIGSLVGEMPQELFNYLNKNRLTANIEYISTSNEHIVDYFKNGKKETYKFLCYTPNNPDELTIDPMESLKHADSIGVPVVDYKKILYSELDEYIIEIRDEENTEGKVAYLVNPKTRKTIGLIKIKSKWYVLIRAIREKIKRWNIDQIPKRIDEIKKWLPMTDKEVGEWKEHGLRFSKWIYNRLNEKVILDSDIYDHYAMLWQKYENDIIDADFRMMIDEEDIVSKPMIIFCSPCPGLGKSTLARALSYLMNGKLDGFWINQDECGGVAKKFHKTISQNIGRSSQLIIDKCLHVPKHRDSFTKQFPTQKLIWISLGGESVEDIRKIAFDRINKRGLNHKSLMSNNPELMKIVNMFLRMWKPVSTDENTQFRCKEIAISDTNENQMVEIIRFLNTLDEYDLTFSSQEISDSLVKSRSDETNMNEKKTYWKASVQGKDNDFFSQCIEWVLGEKKQNEYRKNYKNLIYTRKNEPHVTMLFIKPDRSEDSYNDNEKQVLKECLPLYKKTVDIEVTHVVFNKKCVCMRVKKTFPTCNSIPHITLALVKGIEPYYANYMLENMEEEGGIEVEYKIALKGVVN
jgi:hypothetical protein